VSVSISAVDSGGNEFGVVGQKLAPGGQGWVRIEKDLGHLEGCKVSFTITCDWVDGSSPRKGIPPLVYCGSPILYSCDPDPSDGKWNVILLSIDTLRKDHLGCYGYDRPVSPNLDRFARENILCSNVYAQAPYTLPSHGSLFTSLYPSTHGLESMQNRMPPDVVVLAEALSREGWSTASFNGSGYLSHTFGFSRGFDLYCEVDPLGSRYYGGKPILSVELNDGSSGTFDRTLDWIGEMRERPFFLFLHTYMVHDYLPPREYAEFFNKGSPSDLEPGEAGGMDLRGYKDSGNHSDLSPENLAFFINMYDGTIRAVDDMFAELITHLEALDLYEKTLIIVTSDHGEEFLEHGSLLHMTSVYEELIRIPLIMKVPGRSGGRVIDSTLNQVDIMPTLLDLLAIEAPAGMQGVSFVRLLDGTEGGDRAIYSEVNVSKQVRKTCIMQDGWKYIEGDTSGKLRYPAALPRELYRLDGDPGEIENLSGRHEELENRLRDRMQRFQEELQKARKRYGADSSSSEVSPELMEKLKQQGYL
jgi:arylsulfatase A-like enzyme